MSLLLAAIDREDIARYVGALSTVYLVLIFIRVLLSWVPRMPYNRALRAVVGFIEETTDPYLNLFRRVIPPLGGRIDISPILAILVLSIVSGIVVRLIAG
jgi:YggT family protein